MEQSLINLKTIKLEGIDQRSQNKLEVFSNFSNYWIN